MRIFQSNKTSNDAKQPQTTLDSDLLPTLRTGDTDFFSGNGNAECGSKSTLNTSTYLNLGPYEQYQPVEKNDVCSYHNNTPTQLYTSYHEKGQESWVGNLEIKPEDPNLIPGTENISDQTLCSIEDGNEINSNNNRSVWGRGIGGDDNSNAVDDIKPCNFNFGFSVDDNIKSHMMCERNPNLTGFGECDKENAYYAQLWLDGLWDMSKYVPESDYSKYNLTSEGLLSEDLTEELRVKVEAIRCCLGLMPGYTTNKNNM